MYDESASCRPSPSCAVVSVADRSTATVTRSVTTVAADRSAQPDPGRHRSWGASGQAAVLVVAVSAALLVVVMVAVAGVGRGALDRTRAQTAADAAALASLDGGRSAAIELAAHHDAVVVSWAEGPGDDEVTVVVRVGDAHATARASDAP